MTARALSITPRQRVVLGRECPRLAGGDVDDTQSLGAFRRPEDDRFRYEEFDLYSIKPDGSDLKRLTDAEGNDAHPFWSPDGNYILWSSSRYGFKDESTLSIATPQPYAELFIMKPDGSDQRALTDNQYEDGTPAWMPPVTFR